MMPLKCRNSKKNRHKSLQKLLILMMKMIIKIIGYLCYFLLRQLQQYIYLKIKYWISFQNQKILKINKIVIMNIKDFKHIIDLNK